jgi:inner membrane protein
MASAFSHAVVALAMGKAFRNKELTWRELSLGALCSAVPDLDVIGFPLGIQYGDLWGHRGLTHSVLFAALLAGILVAVWYRTKPTVALTDGGLGVAFFSPFETTRYFFPMRPVLVSPIGISEFFTEYGARVLASEVVWIRLPSCAAFVVLRAIQWLWPTKSAACLS